MDKNHLTLQAKRGELEVKIANVNMVPHLDGEVKFHIPTRAVFVSNGSINSSIPPSIFHPNFQRFYEKMSSYPVKAPAGIKPSFLSQASALSMKLTYFLGIHRSY